MSKPETQFRLGVEKYLPPKTVLHREKMSNPYSAGTADSWYSGARGDLWIEWKYVELPKRDDTLVKIELSALQLHWLKGRHEEGRNVAVIVGCKEGGAIFSNLAWQHPVRRAEFWPHIISRADLAKFITEQCLEFQPSLHHGASDDRHLPDHQHGHAAGRARKANRAA